VIKCIRLAGLVIRSAALVAIVAFSRKAHRGGELAN
jgi:hypothetical protein